MKRAPIQNRNQSAVRGLNFSTIGTAPCTYWLDHSRIFLVSQTCRGWLNLAVRFLAGGVHHAN
jgi:hypothetical protein